MDFDRLRAFVWTIEEGSVSRAADRLHRTQPAVSRLLHTLEEQVGQVLIDRDARPLAPTAAGRQILDVAKQILGLADQLPGMPVHESAARASVRLGVSRALMWHLTRPAFASMSHSFPELDFQVRSDWAARIYHAFCRRELDAAIVLMPTDWSAGAAPNVILIRTEPLAVITSREATGAQNSLLGRNWILNPDGCGFRALVAQDLARRGTRLHVRFEIDAAAQDHITLVAAGLGIAVVPRSTLRHHPQAAQVREIRMGTPLDLAVWLLVNDEVSAFDGLTERLIQVFGELSRRATRRSAQSAR